MAKAEKVTKKVLDAMGNPVGDESLLAKMFNGLYGSEGAAKYLEGFVRSMGSNYVQYDDYPLKNSGDYVHTLGTYLRTLQVAAGVAKKLDIDLQVVSQSFASEEKHGSCMRLLSEDECRWINNILLAFGVSQINYYTYIAKKSNSASDLYYLNDGSFITREGEKTDIYYAYQKINQENNKFSRFQNLDIPTYQQQYHFLQKRIFLT